MIFINLSHHLSFHYGRKPNTIKSSVFTVGKKKTSTKDIPVECTYSIVHNEHDENSFAITSRNSLRIMNLLIQ